MAGAVSIVELFLRCLSISILIWTASETLHLAAIPTLPALSYPQSPLPPCEGHTHESHPVYNRNLLFYSRNSSVRSLSLHSCQPWQARRQPRAHPPVPRGQAPKTLADLLVCSINVNDPGLISLVNKLQDVFSTVGVSVSSTVWRSLCLLSTASPSARY